MNTRLISLDLTNDRSDRDNIGVVFVINERGKKWGSCCAMNLNMEAVCHDS